MNRDEQILDERRIPTSLRCLRRYPGLSISLEPDPRSGDPEVKITELGTGTPITPLPPKNYQRLSLERIGRQLQVAEGLKGALNPFDYKESNESTSIPRYLEFGEDQIGETNQVDAVACAVVNKPFRELLQRSSMGVNLGLHHEDRPFKEPFQRPSFGINIGLHHDDKGDMVMATSLTIDDGTRCLQKLKELNMQEPIRLPKEDTFVALAKARQEVANQSLQEATGADKCVGIQTDVTMEDLLCQRDDKIVDTCSYKIGSSQVLEARDFASISETLDVCEKVTETKDMVPGSETLEMPDRVLAHELGEDYAKTQMHPHEGHATGLEDVNNEANNMVLDSDTAKTRIRASPREPGKDSAKTTVRPHEGHGNGFIEVNSNSTVMMPVTNEAVLHNFLDDDWTCERGEELQELDLPNGILADCLLPVSLPNNVFGAKEVGANNTGTVELDSLIHQSGDNSVARECTDRPETVEDSMERRKFAGLPETTESISSYDLIDRLSLLKVSNQQFENDELSFVQRGRSTPSVPDLFHKQVLQHAETNETLSLPSSYHERSDPSSMTQPCAFCTSSQGADSRPCPADPLSNFQCRLGVLEMSQETELLLAHIKSRGCLMALQICLFILVLFWGGFVEMYVTPPPT